LHISKLRRAVS